MYAAIALGLSLFLGGTVAIATTPVEDKIVEAAADVWTDIKANTEVKAEGSTHVNSFSQAIVDSKNDADVTANAKADVRAESEGDLNLYANDKATTSAHSESDLKVNTDVNGGLRINF